MPSRSEHISSVQSLSVDNQPGVDFLREGLRLLVQTFIELEISTLIEAAPHERNQTRRSYRNGYRRRTWTTSVGDLTIEIPKLRKGTYHPAFFESLRESESVLLESLRHLYEQGVDVNNVKAMVKHVGLSVTAPSQIADVVEQFYDLVDRYRDKPHLRRTDKIIQYRPVNAVSAWLIDTQTANEDFPQSLLTWEPHDWLSESVEVLTRVRHALSDQADAIAA